MPIKSIAPKGRLIHNLTICFKSKKYVCTRGKTESQDNFLILGGVLGVRVPVERGLQLRRLPDVLHPVVVPGAAGAHLRAVRAHAEAALVRRGAGGARVRREPQV